MPNPRLSTNCGFQNQVLPKPFWIKLLTEKIVANRNLRSNCYNWLTTKKLQFTEKRQNRRPVSVSF